MIKNAIFLLSLHLLILCTPCYGASGAISIIPSPQSVMNKNYNVEIKSDWKILVDPKNEGMLFVAGYLNEELQGKFNFALGIQKSASSSVAKSVVLGLSDKELAGLGEEAYTLEVFEDRIVINGNKEVGAFYGIQTLLQLAKEEKGKAVIPAVKIVDHPNLKYRGVHICAADLKRSKEYIDVMAHLKLNIAIIDNWGYYDLDKSDNQQAFQEMFEYAREHYVEPVPELANFGPGGPILKKDPYAAEGISVQEERFKFENDVARPVVASKHSLVNVIRGEDSDFIVQSSDKSKTYKEGVDYKFVEGDISYPYSLDVRPSRIIRLTQGGIGVGEEVLVSYDYVENKCTSWAPWSIPYCPSSERAYKVIFHGLENVINILKPRYIDIGHDEIRGLNRDSRCKKRSMTNAELLADDVNKINDYVKSLDPNIRLMMWDDMVNPWHNGGDENYQVQFGGVAGKTSEAIDLIPKDVIMMIWWGDADDRFSKMKNSPAYFGSKGFNYLAVAYKDKKNIKDWSGLIKNKPSCIGLMTTTWDGWDKNIEGIRYTAEMGWH